MRSAGRAGPGTPYGRLGGVPGRPYGVAADRSLVRPGGGLPGGSGEGRFQPGAGAEEAQLHQDREARDLGAGALDEVDGRLGGATGGQHVVHDQDAVAGGQVLGVHLDLGRAVLQVVGLAQGGTGQLAGLADRDEAQARADGDRGAEDEAPGLQTDDLGGAGGGGDAGERVGQGGERGGVRQERGDVLEHHSRLRVVRDVTDAAEQQLLDVGHRRLPACRPRPRPREEGWLRGPTTAGAASSASSPPAVTGPSSKRPGRAWP